MKRTQEGRRRDSGNPAGDRLEREGVCGTSVTFPERAKTSPQRNHVSEVGGEKVPPVLTSSLVTPKHTELLRGPGHDTWTISGLPDNLSFRPTSNKFYRISINFSPYVSSPFRSSP